MQRNISVKQNGGHASISISRFFYNSRDRMKYRGKKGEIVADMCECRRDTGIIDNDGNPVYEPIASLYAHDGKTCGGVRIGAFACDIAPQEPPDLCALLGEQFPDLGNPLNLMIMPPLIPPVIACEVLDQIPQSTESIDLNVQPPVIPAPDACELLGQIGASDNAINI